MKRLLALGLLLAGPAWAAAPAPKETGPQEPKPGVDPQICNVAYQQDRAVHVHAAVGDNVTLQFGPEEALPKEGGAFAGSDTVTLLYSTVGNLVMLKARAAMPLQPITLRTLKPDGSAHVYVIEWQTGDRGCVLVRWTYAAEEAAARRAAQTIAWRSQRARAPEAALANPPPAPVNRSYSLTGDPRLIPQVTKP